MAATDQPLGIGPAIVQQAITGDYELRVSLPASAVAALGEAAARQAMGLVAEAVAQEILTKRQTEIYQAVSPQAVANLALARVGAAIAEALGGKR